MNTCNRIFKKKLRRVSPLVLLCGLLLFGLVLSSCGDQDKKEFRQESRKKVHLYTSVPVKIIQRLKLEFEKDHPGIELVIFRAGTIKTMEQILMEADKGPIGADVIWLSDFSNAEALKKKGLLQRYISPEAENIIPVFVDREGYYTGSRLLNMVIAYNKRFVKKAPKSYVELLNPAWYGKVGIVNPEISGTSFYTIGTLLQSKDYGWEYYTRLYSNNCKLVDNNPILTEKIAGGELYLGITIDYTVRKLLKESPSLPIGHVFPEDGVVAIASPIALSRDCRNQAQAQQFIDWVLSRKGQEFMSKKMGIAPMREDVEMPRGMIPLSRLMVIPSDPKLISNNKQQIARTFKDIFAGIPIGQIDDLIHSPRRERDD